MQQCARWYHTRYHLQRLCTWYRARFHVLAYRGRGIKFTTMCAKRASGCEIATTRTGSAVRSTAFGTMCAIRLCGIDRGTMNNRSAGHGTGGM